MTHRKAEILLVIVTLVASAGWLFSKFALDEFAPYTFLGVRFILAGLILYGLCFKAIAKLDSSQIVKGIGTGLVLGVALLIWIIGLNSAENIGIGAFIISLNVVLVPIIGHLFFSETIGKSLRIALVPAITGLAFLTLSDDLSISAAELPFIVSTIGFALHINLTRRYAQQIPAMPLTTLQVLATGFIATIAAFIFEDIELDKPLISWQWLLASAIIATSFRFTLQTKALQFVSASHTSLIFVLEPIWVCLLGAVFRAEQMTYLQWAGSALIIIALLIYRGGNNPAKGHFVESEP